METTLFGMIEDELLFEVPVMIKRLTALQSMMDVMIRIDPEKAEDLLDISDCIDASVNSVTELYHAMSEMYLEEDDDDE